MSRSTRQGIGCGIGVVAMVLVPLALVVLVDLGRALAPGPPDGEPLVLAGEQVAGSWGDESGGTLELGADGTFSATAVCGDFLGAAGSGPGGQASVRRRTGTGTGTGTWSLGESSDGPDSVTRVRIEIGPGGALATYEARGSADAPFLWAYIGDPDDGRVCVLRKRA
ncbi:hypothetical protein ACFW6F_26845 [Streptomyces sp. NPDC058746]|uniref:hypothetical protein n=1 Tax=Streptomyces sp. NPDC058746 TaxID=3346622 RepID=UPI0036C4D304